MKKLEAVKEARLGVLMQGGTWYVVRRAASYRAMHESRYEGSQTGRIMETYDRARVQREPPPILEKQVS